MFSFSFLLQEKIKIKGESYYEKTIGIILSVMLSVLAAIPALADFPPKIKAGIPTYSLESIEFIKDKYSKWNRLNEVFKANRATETSTYNETYTRETTSSFNLSIPISIISLEIGYDVEKSISFTFREATSALLEANECAAYYYRKHWKVYEIKEKKTVTSFDPIKNQYVTKISYQTKTIEVPQKPEPDDYGWFYSLNVKALSKTLETKYCSDDYSCKIELK